MICLDSRFQLKGLAKRVKNFIVTAVFHQPGCHLVCSVSEMSYNKRPNLDSSFDDDNDEIPPAKKSKVIESDDEDIDLISSSAVSVCQ